MPYLMLHIGSLSIHAWARESEPLVGRAQIYAYSPSCFQNGQWGAVAVLPRRLKAVIRLTYWSHRLVRWKGIPFSENGTSLQWQH